MLPDGRPRPFFAPQPSEPSPGQPTPGQPPFSQPTSSQPQNNQAQNSQPQDSQPQNSQPQAPGTGWQPTQPAQPGTRPAQRGPAQRGSAQRGSAQRGSVTLEPPGRELRQRAIASAAFGALSLVALLGLGSDLRKGVYVLLFSAAVGIAGAVIGITALVKARKSGTFRPRWAVSGIVLGALAALISMPILITYLAFPTQVNNYVNCLQQAQNSSQQQACMSKFYKSIHLSTSAAPGAHPARELGA